MGIYLIRKERRHRLIKPIHSLLTLPSTPPRRLLSVPNSQLPTSQINAQVKKFGKGDRGKKDDKTYKTKGKLHGGPCIHICACMHIYVRTYVYVGICM